MKMKRILFILFFALTTLMALHAQAPTALWGKAVETAKFTAGSDLCLGTDGSLYVVGNANTRTEEEYIRLGADNLAPGSLYRGTNTNASVGAIYLSKLSRDGQPLWTVYTRDADAMSNSLFVQPTADGVVAFVGLRHVEKGATHSPYFTDAKGRQVSLEWTLEADDSPRYYMTVVLKVSHDGEIQWLRKVVADHAPQPAATSSTAKKVTAQGIWPNAFTQDAAGHLYLGCRQTTELTLQRSDGSTVRIAPRHVEGWDGTSTAGDLTVIKLDREGYYMNCLQTEGDVSLVNLSTMTHHQGRLYIAGYIVPTAEKRQVTIGGQTMTLANDYATPFVASMKCSDLAAEWAQAYTAQKSGFTLQTPRLMAANGHLWWAGMGSLSLTTKSGKTLEIGENMNRVATLLQFDLNNGDLLDGYLKPLFQTGYFALMTDEAGSIYAAGYAGVLSSSSNPNKRATAGGLYIDRFNPADLTSPVSSWDDMIQNAGAGTTMVCDRQGRLFTLTRSQSNDNALTGGSLKVAQTGTSFAANICAFQLPVRPMPLAGDANGDGIVSLHDILAIADSMQGKAPATFDAQAADVNGDGRVDVSDIVRLVAN